MRIVCASHQSDWGCYKQPIKLPLVEVNHVWEEFIPVLGQNGHLSFLSTETRILVLALFRHSLSCVIPRIGTIAFSAKYTLMMLGGFRP